MRMQGCEIVAVACLILVIIWLKIRWSQFESAIWDCAVCHVPFGNTWGAVQPRKFPFIRLDPTVITEQST